jgi:putative SOS response-associated peptidase YedK
MCGRFVGYRNKEELLRYFPIDRVEAEAVRNYNVAPSQMVLAIIREDDANVLRQIQWGLVPFWAKDPSIGSRMINARAETVAEKPSFRNALKKDHVYADWLDTDRQEVDLKAILNDGMHTELKARPVSNSVNSVKNNSPELIE